MGGCGGATPPHPDRLPITSPQQKPDQVQLQPAAELKWGGHPRTDVKSRFYDFHLNDTMSISVFS